MASARSHRQREAARLRQVARDLHALERTAWQLEQQACGVRKLAAGTGHVVLTDVAHRAASALDLLSELRRDLLHTAALLDSENGS